MRKGPKMRVRRDVAGRSGATPARADYSRVSGRDASPLEQTRRERATGRSATRRKIKTTVARPLTPGLALAPGRRCEGKPSGRGAGGGPAYAGMVGFRRLARHWGDAASLLLAAGPSQANLQLAQDGHGHTTDSDGTVTAGRETERL